MNEVEFYTVAEFAKHLRIHPNTVRKGIKKGRIQAFRVGEGLRSEFRISATEVQRISEMDMTRTIQRIVEEELEKRNDRQI